MKRKSETPDKVIFYADGHTYWWGEQQLKSVGHFMKPYFPPFRDNYWRTHSVFKEIFGKEYTDHYSTFPLNQRRTGPPAKELFVPFIQKLKTSEFAREKERFKMKWDKKRNESAFRGTKFHDEQERKEYEQGFMFNPWTGENVPLSKDNKGGPNGTMFYDNESLMLDLSNLSDGSYPELLVFNLDLLVAGQADRVFIETIDGVRYVDIDDHKTNEKLPAKSGPERCYPPFESMYACDHFKYVLQINSYAYLLSLFGFVPRHLGYTHYKDYDFNKSTRVPVENIQAMMPAVVEDYLKDEPLY